MVTPKTKRLLEAMSALLRGETLDWYIDERWALPQGGFQSSFGIDALIQSTQVFHGDDRARRCKV